MAELTAQQVIANLTAAGYAPTAQQIQRAQSAGFNVGAVAPTPSPLPPLAPFVQSPPAPTIISAPTPISVAGLVKEEVPIAVPPSPAQTDYQSVVAGIPEIASLLVPQKPTQIEAEKKTLQERLLGAIQKLGGRGTAQVEAEKIAEVPSAQRAVQELGTQLTSLKNEALAIPIQIQNESIARGITGAGIFPIQQSRLRENALKSLQVSSLLQAAQGQLSLAQAQADRVVALEFADEENQIAYLKTALEINKEEFSQEQAERAERIKFQLNERSRLLEQIKEDKSAILALANMAVKNNPDNPQVVSAAQEAIQSGRLETAYALLGQYQTNPTQVAQDIQDLENSRRQEELTQANISKVLTEAITSPSKNNANELKDNALTSAQNLLTKLKTGEGTTAVGKSAFLGTFGYALIPGTQRANFIVQFNNLKSLLSLDNVKYLKGQGQVSDAERRLLEQASAKLDLSQSEAEFQTALESIIGALNGERITNFATQVSAKGYDYSKMKADGLSDEKIKLLLGI